MLKPSAPQPSLAGILAKEKKKKIHHQHHHPHFATSRTHSRVFSPQTGDKHLFFPGNIHLGRQEKMTLQGLAAAKKRRVQGAKKTMRGAGGIKVVGTAGGGGGGLAGGAGGSEEKDKTS